MPNKKTRKTRKLCSWILEQVNSGKYPGVVWEDEAKTMFRIPWKHAGKQYFRRDEDAAFFKAWAEYKDNNRKASGSGSDTAADWKTRMRCALNKSEEFSEVRGLSQRNIDEPYKVYRLVPRSEQGVVSETKGTKQTQEPQRIAPLSSINQPPPSVEIEHFKVQMGTPQLCIKVIVPRRELTVETQEAAQQTDGHIPHMAVHQGVSPEQESSPSLLQEQPEPLQIKEEQEELPLRPEEPDGSTSTLLAVKSEDDDEVELEIDTDVTDDSDDWGETNGAVHTTREKPFQCKHCDKSYYRRGHLKTHERSHTGEKTFHCQKCDKSFSESGSLKIHRRVHSGEKPFHCTYCNRRFSQSGHLATHHQRIHTKPFHCKHCVKSFGYLHDLKRHQHVHTQEKPFLCKRCDKSFKFPNSLAQHPCVRNGEKPFHCKHCDKRFITSSLLTKHQRIHTGEKPFHCKHCDKSFSRSSKLTQHQRIHTDILVCKDEVSQKRSPSLLQEEPEPPQIKEEQEELLRPGEPDGSMLTAVKSECNEVISSRCAEVEVELESDNESDNEVTEDSDEGEETGGGVMSQSTQIQVFSCYACPYAFTSQDFLHKHVKRNQTESRTQQQEPGETTGPDVESSPRPAWNARTITTTAEIHLSEADFPNLTPNRETPRLQRPRQRRKNQNRAQETLDNLDEEGSMEELQDGRQTTPDSPTSPDGIDEGIEELNAITPATESPQAEDTEEEEDNISCTAYKPRKHEGKKKNWRLHPNKPIVIMGDSNLATIPTYSDSNVQIESYPGMNLEWAITVLEHTEVNEETERLILSVGLTNMDQKSTVTSQKNLGRLIKIAKTKFPNANRQVALINFSEDLEENQKWILTNLNKEIKKTNCLPMLDPTKFKTQWDNVHWTRRTATSIFDLWMESLN